MEISFGFIEASQVAWEVLRYYVWQLLIVGSSASYQWFYGKLELPELA